MRLEAFTPMGALVTGAATATVALVNITDHPAKGGGSCLVSNDGTNTVFFKFGDSSVVATLLNGAPILAGESRLFGMGPQVTHASVICAATETGNVHFVPGRGN